MEKVTLLIESAVPSDIDVQVQNLIGEVLLETSYTHRSSVNEELNLGGLPNGLYLIRVDTESGSVNRRIVAVWGFGFPSKAIPGLEGLLI